MTTVYVSNLEEVSATGGITLATTSYYAGGQRIAQAVNGVFSYWVQMGWAARRWPSMRVGTRRRAPSLIRTAVSPIAMGRCRAATGLRDAGKRKPGHAFACPGYVRG